MESIKEVIWGVWEKSWQDQPELDDVIKAVEEHCKKCRGDRND
jgi:hypothetical protein